MVFQYPKEVPNLNPKIRLGVKFSTSYPQLLSFKNMRIVVATCFNSYHILVDPLCPFCRIFYAINMKQKTSTKKTASRTNRLSKGSKGGTVQKANQIQADYLSHYMEEHFDKGIIIDEGTIYYPGKKED